MTEAETPLLFDAHVHLRGGAMLRAVAPETARWCGEAVVMPNVPAIDSAVRLADYRDEILAAVEGGPPFKPLMTLKLTQRTAVDDIEGAARWGAVACKLYPAGVTTGSHGGVTDPAALDDIFAAMAYDGLVLCVHGEMPGSFVLDRERDYLRTVAGIAVRHPKLRVVLEHVTTREAVGFVRTGPPNLAATITAHHLELTLDDVLGGGGIRPHAFCYPVAKRPEDRMALYAAATDPDTRKFFLGSDSAPHLAKDKESACGCAGIYAAPALPFVLADVFFGDPQSGQARGRHADAFRRFCCLNGPGFYGRPVASGRLVFRDEPCQLPPARPLAAVVRYGEGRTFRWSVGRCG